MTLRVASDSDLDALVDLECACFQTDRLSRRSFRRFIDSRSAQLIVAEAAGELLGYALVLFRRGARSARLYSIAVWPGRQGQAIGEALLVAAEQDAMNADRIELRLEVRPDNASAIALYRRKGYRQYRLIHDYYEDHTDALQMRKWLKVEPPLHQTPPYFAQTTDFSCGPAAALMAMRALCAACEPSEKEELRLWREATSIFTSAGHGGCDPIGLAVALTKRSFATSIHCSQPGPYFLDSVRSQARRRAMAIVQTDYEEQAHELGIPVFHQALSASDLRAALDSGAMAVVLVSLYRMTGTRLPHWIMVFAHDDKRFFCHDPWVEVDAQERPIDAADLPIPFAEFDAMARYGRDRLKATVLVRRHAHAGAGQ